MRSVVRKLMVLPFIPIDLIEQAFNDLSNQAPPSLKLLFDYFNGYWMRKVKWSLWNVSGLEMRTNNLVEGLIFNTIKLLVYYDNIGWNHRFNRLVNRSRPNVWHLFDCLKKEEVCVRQQLLKMATGVQKKRDSKTIGIQHKLDILDSRFKDKKINVDRFLEGLSLVMGTK